VAERLGVHAVGTLGDEERVAKLDAAVAAAGWRELRSADDDGAPWASAVEVAIVAEELARGLADTPLLGPTLAADLRRRAGAPPATAPETVIPDLATGLAIDSSGAPTALALDGESRLARSLATDPDYVQASRQRTELRLVSVAVEAVDPPVDLTRGTAVVAPGAEPAAVEGASALTDDDVAAWTALGLATTCADLVGTMRGAVQLATDYAKERRQYGQPIGSFQAVQHLLADAHVATEGSRSAALHAAWAVDALPPSEAIVAASVAKAWCARAARTVCETAIQVHGGIGNTWDCLAHVHLRRALLSIDAFGGVGPSLARVVDDRLGGGDRGLR